LIQKEKDFNRPSWTTEAGKKLPSLFPDQKHT